MNQNGHSMESSSNETSISGMIPTHYQNNAPTTAGSTSSDKAIVHKMPEPTSSDPMISISSPQASFDEPESRKEAGGVTKEDGDFSLQGVPSIPDHPASTSLTPVKKDKKEKKSDRALERILDLMERDRQVSEERFTMLSNKISSLETLVMRVAQHQLGGSTSSAAFISKRHSKSLQDPHLMASTGSPLADGVSSHQQSTLFDILQIPSGQLAAPGSVGGGSSNVSSDNEDTASTASSIAASAASAHRHSQLSNKVASINSKGSHQTNSVSDNHHLQTSSVQQPSLAGASDAESLLPHPSSQQPASLEESRSVGSSYPSSRNRSGRPKKVYQTSAFSSSMLGDSNVPSPRSPTKANKFLSVVKQAVAQQKAINEYAEHMGSEWAMQDDHRRGKGETPDGKSKPPLPPSPTERGTEMTDMPKSTSSRKSMEEGASTGVMAKSANRRKVNFEDIAKNSKRKNKKKDKLQNVSKNPLAGFDGVEHCEEEVGNLSVTDTDEEKATSGDGTPDFLNISGYSDETKKNGRKSGRWSQLRKSKIHKPQPAIDPASWSVGCMDFAYIATTVASFIVSVSLIHPLNGFDLEAFPASWFIGWIAALSAYSFAFLRQRMWIRCRQHSGSWLLMDNTDEVWDHYKRHWFTFDLLMAVPIEFAFISWWNLFFVYFSAARNFLRYFRVLSLGAQANPMEGERSWYRFAAFCGSMMMVAHGAASGFWAVMFDTINYVDALYWAVATMTSVGYGDVTPVTESQRIYAIVCMFTGILLISSFTALATAFLTGKDAIQNETDKNKEMMSALLRYYRVPWRISKEVINVFPSVLDATIQQQFRTNIDNLPTFLRDELSKYVNASQLRSIKFFEGISDELLLDVAAKMHMEFVPAFDYIIEQGDVAQSMYVIVHGVVEVTVVSDNGEEEIVLSTLRDGDFFGEVSLMKEDAKRNANVLAVVSCQLLVLDKATFDDVMAASDEVKSRVLHRADTRVGIESIGNFGQASSTEASMSISAAAPGAALSEVQNGAQEHIGNKEAVDSSTNDTTTSSPDALAIPSGEQLGRIPPPLPKRLSILSADVDKSALDLSPRSETVQSSSSNTGAFATPTSSVAATVGASASRTTSMTNMNHGGGGGGGTTPSIGEFSFTSSTQQATPMANSMDGPR